MLFVFRPIDKIQGSRPLIKELKNIYGRQSIKHLNESGLKFNVSIMDNDPTILDWKYLNDTFHPDIPIYKIHSRKDSFPIIGYAFNGTVIDTPTSMINYFEIAPGKKIGLEIVIENNSKY